MKKLYLMTIAILGMGSCMQASYSQKIQNDTEYPITVQFNTSHSTAGKHPNLINDEPQLITIQPLQIAELTYPITSNNNFQLNDIQIAIGNRDPESIKQDKFNNNMNCWSSHDGTKTELYHPDKLATKTMTIESSSIEFDSTKEFNPNGRITKISVNYPPKPIQT